LRGVFSAKAQKIKLDFYKVAFLVLNSIKRKKHFIFYTLRGLGATRLLEPNRIATAPLRGLCATRLFRFFVTTHPSKSAMLNA
jgi:hypothetical protein